MSDTENEIVETGRRRQDFQDTTRATFEESERYIRASREKTERLRALRLARERGEH